VINWVRQGGRPTRIKADGEVRRSQAIRTYGAGSLMDLVNRSVLVGGLDFWRFGTDGATPIQETRLRESVVAALAKLDDPPKLSSDRPFILPPAGVDGEPQKNNGVEVFEFPQWFVCQACRALTKAPQGVELKNERWQHLCDSGKASPAVPVRFIIACKNGHLDEVPWMYFVHEGQQKPRCQSQRLTLLEGKTGDFSEVTVRCVCGLSRALAIALAPEANPPCKGYRPWLGPEAQEECQDGRPRLVMRGAINTYFPQTMSALTIPESTSELVEQVRGLMDVLANATKDNLSVLRTAISKLAALGNASNDDVLEAVERVKNPENTQQIPLRTAEYLQLTSQSNYQPGVLPKPNDVFFARTYRPAGGLPSGIAKLVLASRLREVSVQIGFTRLEAPTADLQGEFDLGVEHCRLGLNTDWLPTSETWGEGTLVQLDEDAVRAWEDRPEVKARGKILLEGYDAWAAGRDRAPAFPGVRFYLLHSLSHLLINAIAVECGYSAAALSERIYCAPRNDGVPMAAILISTGTRGTEGTFGGLVEQGKRILGHLQRAYDMGRLCSTDPICAYHKPAADPTRRYREGAACHGCLYVAEPSCERFNCYLDRALVVPVMGQPARLAFFTERPTPPNGDGA
jgi:hypothetical protein